MSPCLQKFMASEDFQKGNPKRGAGLGLRDKIRVELDKNKEKSDEVCRQLVRRLKIEERILEAAEQGNKEAWIELPDCWRIHDWQAVNRLNDRGKKLTSSSSSNSDVKKLNKWLFGKDSKEIGYDLSITNWRFAKIRLYELLEEQGFKVRTESVRRIAEMTIGRKWLVLSFENFCF